MDEQSADFWRAKYEALSARIADPVATRNAIELVEAAARVSRVSALPFREVFTKMMEVYYRQQGSRRGKKR